MHFAGFIDHYTIQESTKSKRNICKNYPVIPGEVVSKSA
jgi:hypothetical protein